MDVVLYDQAQKIWRQIAKEKKSSEELSFELEVHKKLLNIFQVGDYSYMIFNCMDSVIEYIHESVTTLLGYTPEEFTIKHMMECIHPEDISWFVNFENTVTDFFTKLPVDKVMKYKVRYDYRIRKANGEYIRILQQAITIQTDENGGVLRTLGMHTDITHLKPEGKPVLSFIGLDGEPSYFDVQAKQILLPSTSLLTERESEILAFITKGHLSKEIGACLGISKETVDKHRKNMLRKTNTKSFAELVAKATKEGWL